MKPKLKPLVVAIHIAIMEMRTRTATPPSSEAGGAGLAARVDT